MAEPLLSDRMKMLLVMGSLLAFNVMCGFGIQRLSSQREMIKEDYSQVNSIRYGLLSVDAWKERIRAVVAGRIGDFSLSKAQEGVLLGEISRVLDALIVEADKALQKRQRGLSGKMRKIAIRAFVSVQDLRRRVPEFSQAVVDELQTPGHTKKLKALAQSGFDGYAAQSFDRAEDTAHLRGLLQRHQAGDVPAFNRAAEQRLRELESDIRAYCVVMLDSALAFLFAWWLLRRKQELHRPLFSMSAAFALVLLVVGLALPMIDLDARIKSVDFLFWGERIEFHDQVLFFRSKSILQVVKVLMDTGKADSILVGALLVLFSVLFPAAKLAAMELLMRGGEKPPESKLLDFFAFRSGKWSMADVTVVAIFIAYIGFKGILNTQLAGLNVKAAYVEVIATNDTALQPGFILFTAFVLFAFALSEIVKRAGHMPDRGM